MLESLYQRDNYVAAKKLLDVVDLRHRALTSNIANAETPGYKRVDLDPAFQTKLEKALRVKDVNQVQSFQPTLAIDKRAAALRPDGNNVSIPSEMLEMNKNSLEFEFLTNYLTSSIKRLKMSITGRNE